MKANNSEYRFVIRIKAGVYNETVEVSREKVNIMLVGEGMNKTLSTGSQLPRVLQMGFCFRYSYF